MNVEKLYGIANQVLRDLAATDVISQLDQLIDALTAVSRDPQDESTQRRVQEIRRSLSRSLLSAPSNSYHADELQLLEALDLRFTVGADLWNAIDSEFVQEQLTPAVVADELRTYLVRLSEARDTLDRLTQSLYALHIEAEELQTDEFEVAVLIPRPAVDEELSKLGGELRALEKVFRPFQELATGSHQNLTVRSIASSDFGIYLSVDPETAAVIVRALADILKAFAAILEIRRYKRELEQKVSMPEENLAGLVQHADQLMASTIDQVSEKLIDDYKHNLPDNREHEMRTALKVSLSDMAHRVDVGFDFEVRSGPAPELPPPDEVDEDVMAEIESTQAAKTRALIDEHRQELAFVNIAGTPILSLPRRANPIGGEADEEE